MKTVYPLGLMVFALGSCGADDGSSSIAAAPPSNMAPPSAAPAPTPAPTPTPTPSSPAPTPTAIEPYALGTLTYALEGDMPADKASAIRSAMDFTVAHFNALGSFSGTVSVVYGSATPTADAGYRGQIRFGGSIGRRVALHEMEHWLGIGTTDKWARMVANGKFTGPLANARIRAYDGDSASVNADSIHFWPYGQNFDDEFSNPQRHTQMVSAMLDDMGLADDLTAAVAGTRRFQNRSSELVLQASPNGSAPVETGSTSSTSQRWTVTFSNGFIRLLDGDNGLTIEAMAAGNDAAAVMATPVANRASQTWEMIPVGEGEWFLLRNRESNTCLDNIGDTRNGAPLRLWSCGAHPNQQWRLVR